MISMNCIDVLGLVAWAGQDIDSRNVCEDWSLHGHPVQCDGHDGWEQQLYMYLVTVSKSTLYI
jgi:hypothetical protein